MIRRPRPNPGAAVRLICVPFAGGAASAFHAWPAGLPDWIEVLAIEPPGRGTRLAERAPTRVTEAVPAFADALLPELDRPYALFGHSLGALVCFELARELRRRRAPQPAVFFASARRAPHLPKRSGPVHTLSDAGLTRHLRELNGTPEQVLENAELMALVLPTVRADLEADETYILDGDETLGVPIVALGGADDRTFPLEDLAAWAEHTGGAFELTLFDGDHFFINSARAQVLERIAATIQAALRQPTAHRSRPELAP